MRKIRDLIEHNRTRLATAAVALTGAAITGLASAQTAGNNTTTLDAGALAQGATNGVQSMVNAGGPAVFGLVGVATGVIFLINRVRSLG